MKGIHMAQWDRFDICKAYALLEADYNVGGWLQERPSNVRRMESIGVQLARMGFHLGLGEGGYDDLSDNGKEIYLDAVLKLGLPKDDEQISRLKGMFVPEYLARFDIH